MAENIFSGRGRHISLLAYYITFVQRERERLLFRTHVSFTTSKKSCWTTFEADENWTTIISAATRHFLILENGHCSRHQFFAVRKLLDNLWKAVRLILLPKLLLTFLARSFPVKGFTALQESSSWKLINRSFAFDARGGWKNEYRLFQMRRISVP